MAGKYKKGLVNEVKADIAYEKEQEKLKEKYSLYTWLMDILPGKFQL